MRLRLLVALLAVVACGQVAPAAKAAAVSRPSPSPTAAHTHAVGILRSPSPAPVRVVLPSPSPPSDLLAQVNADRAGQHLGRLTFNSCLAAVAQERARMTASASTAPWDASAKDDACGLNDPQTAEVGGVWTGGVDAVALNGLLMHNSADRNALFFQWYCCAGYAWAIGAHGYGYAVIELG